MNSNLEIDLTHIAATGEAVGRDEDGHAVFVADAIPGETVQVEPVPGAKRWRRGILRKVLKASPDRVEPPCPHFGPPHPVTTEDGSLLNPSWRRAGCAGCQWQQIDYERQLALKREIIVTTIARDARPGSSRRRSRQWAEQLVSDVIALGAHYEDSASDAPAVLDFGFRTQMRFEFGPSRQLTLPDRNGAPLAVEACPLHHPQLAQLFAGFQSDPSHTENAEESESAPEPENPSVDGVTLAVGGTADSLSEAAKGVLILHSERGGPPSLELDLPVNVFFLQETVDPSLELLVGDWSYAVQVQDQQLTAFPPVLGEARSGHLLADEVLAAVAADLLELKPFEHLLELWAGIGARTTILAEQAATVVAVEETELLSAALRANLDRLDNADAWHGEIMPAVRKLRRGNYSFDTVLLSPPQGIVNPELFSLLTRMRIRRCAFITDEPTRLARALDAVNEAGYRLTAVQPIDLKPHQPGATLVARFDRI